MQDVVTVALVVILFEGGTHIGWRRFRSAAGAIVWVGVAGTVVTAAAVATVAHLLFGFGWQAALLLGAALAPTDPAVVFSVLGRREVIGRSGVLLEGESGTNDPVGIALMMVLLGSAGGSLIGRIGAGAGEFALQLGIGGLIGVAGGWGLRWLMQRVPLPSEGLYPLRTLAFGGLVYGLATVVHGSGFLAVFAAGVVIGDINAPYKREVERFLSATSSLAEVVAFVVLGVTVGLNDLGGAVWVGVGIGLLLMWVIRPVLVGLVLWPVRLRLGERVFVLWSGLKGAVPILLGTFAVSSAVAGAERIYEVIFVVVALSVMVQGTTVPLVARWRRVLMRVVEPEPWTLGMRFRERPAGVRRFTVQAGAPADGAAIGGLRLHEDAWISLVSRDGRPVPVKRDTVLQARDDVLVIVGADEPAVRQVFCGPVERRRRSTQ
ncbi:cation:proton antiporter [Dactylosporangium aurantiacum]|uniref:Cation:proton antiporter n=1 Tax=Dactylosporangium aurantiacum TaxID=35754 RepID=A0A9Q9IM12_9ACTN|nr:cation:proton antiporter [Dactylosporangium aurantiacum]MDG6110336.1 cation:proton antiporter [Dactylosporangium aurantiacum]UWZ58622.1 cation:proton antiporter [Dactylosporangium aurantiacum]